MDKLTIKDFFDKAFGHLTFDDQLAKDLYRFQVGFVNKNPEHMEFFGGNLFGVHVVRFTDRDSNNFFGTILDIDPIELKEGIDELPGINPNWKVSSDAFHLTCMYLIHRFLTSKDVSEDFRAQAAKDVGLIFNYKCFTALLAGYVKYPVDPKIAQAMYANLSNRYLIKKLDNWQNVFLYRVNELLDKNGLWIKTLTQFGPDKDIVDMVNDTQGRIRDMMKNLMQEFKQAHMQGDKIHSTSSVGIDTDGTEVIKDRVHGPEMYQNYLLSVLADENSFIREELINVVCKIMPGMQVRGFRTSLAWISRNAHDHHHETVDKFVRSVLIYSIEYLSRHGYLLRDSKDLAGITSKLKNLYLASRSSDSDLAEIRDMGTQIVREAYGKTSDQAAAAIRTGLVLYICLRAFTKHHYTS